MRVLRGLGLLLAAATGLSDEARAGVTVDLLFVGIDGGAITPTNSLFGPSAGSGSHVLDMVVRLTSDVALASHSLSLAYDLAASNDHLHVLRAGNWEGIATGPQGERYTPAALPVPSTATSIGPYTSARSAPGGSLPASAGAFAGGYDIGTVVWQTTGIFSYQTILPGLFAPGDGFFDANGNSLGNTVLFNGATLGVPEPATAALLGLGVLGLALAGRRRRA